MVDPVESIAGLPEEVLGDLSCKVSLRTERLSAVAVETVRSLAGAVVELAGSLLALLCGSVESKLVRIVLEEILDTISIDALVTVESIEVKRSLVAVVRTDRKSGVVPDLPVVVVEVKVPCASGIGRSLDVPP